LRERREQEQHIPRNAEQRHSRAKKNSRDKNKKKKRKNYENGRRRKRRPVPHPSRKSFSFSSFWSSRRTSAAGGLEIISKKKTAKNLFLISSRGHFRAKKEIREPVPIQSVECRKKLSVQKVPSAKENLPEERNIFVKPFNKKIKRKTRNLFNSLRVGCLLYSAL
jgi:hypothetical protein